MPELISHEVECLKLKKAINENHRLAQESAKDALERAILTGKGLCRWKEMLPRGQFEPFVEKHFDGSLRTAQLYMQVAKGLEALPKSATVALFNTEDSLRGLVSRLKNDDSVAAGREARNSEGTPGTPKGGSNPPATTQISEKGKPGSEGTSATPPVSSSRPDEAADSSGNVSRGGESTAGNCGAAATADSSSGEDERTETQGKKPQETDPRPPRSGKDKPGTGYVGKCPNCASSKWTEEGNCAKCNQPFGEPVGDRTEEDPAGTLREKTRKTAEALMRCFDDLNLLCPKAGSHKQAIELCKSLLKSAKGWK